MKNVKIGEITTLKGQRQINIPVKSGLNVIYIKLLSGRIRINHGAYTPDGGTWLSAPSGRNSNYIFSKSGEYVIKVDIQKSFGKTDILYIVNPSFFTNAIFQIRTQADNDLDVDLIDKYL